MQIIEFNRAWMEQAQGLIRSGYLDERKAVPALPEKAAIPSLDALAGNGLGVAAVEDGKLLGFLGAYGPWQPVFCTPDVRGVFSPLHAHAVQREGAIKVWRRLYQAAAEKWAAAGAASHAITIHAHDEQAREALYLYGFGVRCMDLIRPMTETGASADWMCCELEPSRRGEITPLRRELARHLAQSPCFMRHDPQWLGKWLAQKETADTRIFAAMHGAEIAAFIETDEEGENYASCAPGMMNICGAYCMPQYRGTGAAQAALDCMIRTFREEGYTRLGVDCESFNPTALGFWRKYFDVYTHSVVRRIDENAVK